MSAACIMRVKCAGQRMPASAICFGKDAKTPSERLAACRPPITSWMA